MVEKDTKKVGRSFRENIAYLEQILPVKESFDIVRRDMEDRRAGGDVLLYRRVYKRRVHAEDHGLFI